MPLSKKRILVVDDAAIIRKLVAEVLSRDPRLEVVGTAPNGRIALQKLPQLSPDLITLDMEMPEMGGIETLREIRKVYPNLPVIMLSSLTSRGAESTLEALEAGANDYVAKPTGTNGMVETMDLLEKELLPKVKAQFRGGLAEEVLSEKSNFAGGRVRRGRSPQLVRALCIGTSTGGPNALVKLFSGIERALSVPIFIVQHMPPIFTKTLAERLDRIGPIRFFEAEEGQAVEPGCAYIAPGGKHMEVFRNGGKAELRLNEGPLENSCRPAVDVLFRSVAESYGSTALALVLTGMGKDGYRGCEKICELGGRALAQDEESSVVWGMPGYVSREGLAEQTLPLDRIAAAICCRIESRLPIRS